MNKMSIKNHKQALEINHEIRILNRRYSIYRCFKPIKLLDLSFLRDDDLSDFLIETKLNLIDFTKDLESFFKEADDLLCN
jgi:hypothetical protein